MQPSTVSNGDSQVRSQNQRKYHYLAGTSVTTNPNLTASSIDQHRNSIEQRIANLENKLSKTLTVPQTQSDNYVNTRRMYQYSATACENQQQIGRSLVGSQPRVETGFVKQLSSNKASNPYKQIQASHPYKYLNNEQQQIADEAALRDKYKFSSHANTQSQSHHVVSREPGSKLKAVFEKSSTRIDQHIMQNPLPLSTKDRAVGKKIKNNIPDNKNQNQNRKPSEITKPYQSQQKFNRKYPHSANQTPSYQHLKKDQSIQRRQNQQRSILNTRHLQDNFNQLNTHISNLNKYTITGTPYNNYPFENYHNQTVSQSRTISYEVGSNINTSQINSTKNNDLYEMMKSIMVGQQRLEKELMMLKQNKTNEEERNRNNSLNTSNLRYSDSVQPYHIEKKVSSNTAHSHTSITNHNLRNIPESRLMSPIQQQPEQKISSTKPHTAHHTQSRSPQLQTRKSKSPRLSKSPRKVSKSPAQNKSGHKTRQTSAIKRKRANSAVTGKKVAGKIQKNKERFYQLYKQAQTNKRLNQSNTRISISNEVVSSVWQKIKESITRAEQQDIETSLIYHENNRSVNDHLVSKIELQKKLKNDLVKKVYDMCENKCLFK